MTAARAAGTPLAVNTGGGTTTAVVGGTVVLAGAATFLGSAEHPPRARALTRSAEIPRKAAGREEGSKR
jgi:hypothetical protein